MLFCPKSFSIFDVLSFITFEDLTKGLDKFGLSTIVVVSNPYGSLNYVVDVSFSKFTLANSFRDCFLVTLSDSFASRSSSIASIRLVGQFP